MWRLRLGSLRRTALVLLTAACVTVASGAADPASANRKYAAIVIDGKTGEVLFSRKADYRRYPASLTKVMTLYMVFEALEEGKLKLTEKIPMSKRCAGMPPSDLRMKPGEKVAVKKAIVALIVRSANDVACAVAEKLGGTETKFAVKMTKKARAIGMKKSKFRNASGLYHRGQITTARDMATLALRIQKDFPQYYHFFKSLKVTWKGRTWSTHNRLMKYFPGADGLKTGYIRASGFNLITSARRGNMHLVGVVMGGRKSRSRDGHMVNILERNFARLLKRDKYVYPIADRLPEVRPKPNFAAIESREWLLKKVGVMPRPNPFQPDKIDRAKMAVAKLDKEPPEPVSGGGAGTESGTEAAEPTARPESGAKAADTAAPESSKPAVGTNNRKTKATGERKTRTAEARSESPKTPLPVLGASGSGTRPAGAGTPASAKSPSPSSPKPDASGAERRVAATASPDGSRSDPARLIEEGDGQVGTDDLAGQLPASSDEQNDSGDNAVRLASAGPAASHMGASLLAPTQWGVQLGAFTSIQLAEVHLDNAERLQPDVLTREKSALLPKQDGSGKLYRARFGPMDEAEARAACEKLKAGGMHCFALAADDWGEAVRR
ncbi:MAG: serine hydrolase [bacterium]